MHGIVKKGCALKRSGARVGDHVYVSGNIGDGAGALPLVLKDSSLHSELTARYHKPYPQIMYGQSLVGVASACLDISDGLIQDLNHICKKSGVGMVINSDNIPLSDALLRQYSKAQALEYALTGGDDYLLAFTASPTSNVPDSAIHIGRVIKNQSLEVIMPQGIDLKISGYNHFD